LILLCSLCLIKLLKIQSIQLDFMELIFFIQLKIFLLKLIKILF